MSLKHGMVFETFERLPRCRLFRVLSFEYFFIWKGIYRSFTISSLLPPIAASVCVFLQTAPGDTAETKQLCCDRVELRGNRGSRHKSSGAAPQQLYMERGKKKHEQQAHVGGRVDGKTAHKKTKYVALTQHPRGASTSASRRTHHLPAQRSSSPTLRTCTTPPRSRQPKATLPSPPR